MPTVIPHPATAAIHAGLHPATITAVRAATSTPGSAAGGVALLVLLAAFILLAFTVRITRQLGDLLSQLFQVAATLGSALVMVIIVTVLTVVLLLHS